MGAFAKFVFITKEKEGVLPQKFCGFYLALTQDNSMLNIASPMVCRNSYKDMEAVVSSLDTTHGPTGVVDNLDPTEDTLSHLDHEVSVGAVVVMCVGYIGWALFWISNWLRGISPRPSLLIWIN